MSFSRRMFLSGCAACAARAVCKASGADALVSSVEAAPTAKERAKLRLVFTHIAADKPTWPNIGFDYESRKKELLARLAAACPNVELVPSTVHNAAEARALVAQDAEFDGTVWYMLGLWSGSSQTLLNTGKPVLLVDDLYGGSGEFLITYAVARRQGLKVAGVSSSRFDDVVQGVNTFDAIKRLRSTTIVDVVDRSPGTGATSITDVFGTGVKTVDSKEYNEAFRSADTKEGQAYAKRWTKAAQKVIEPTAQEIEDSGTMYIALKDLMKRYSADAITVDCLGLFYAGKAPAYPCLGFFQLNNDGYVGACEADLQSTVTMLAMSYLTRRPGFISDPVIDTSKNQIIYAHCVAPAKVYGPDGPAAAYYIRSHSEDRKGASVRVLMPLNEPTTTLKINPASRQIILHQAKSVANIDEDKACRTKLAAEPRDARRMFDEWDRWGWHRVTFYGDLRQPVETLAGLLGLSIVNEG
jgi:hypothetical protein